MKKIFTFKENIMNGTVTMSSKVVAFASRELAEKTRQAVIAANRDNEPGYKMCPSEITETEVFETEDDVFILSGKNEHKEDEKWPSGMGYIHIGTPEAVEDYLKREREGKLTISERRPAWETADCWNALDYKTFERIFKMAIDDDASIDERIIVYDIVRQFSGVLTSEKVIGWVSDKMLRMEHDADLESIIKAMRDTWIYRMPPMTFADHCPVISIDWQQYIDDRKHGKITVTFKTEFLH